MIGKSVAKKPYMNLMLNNNVTDTGTGANTPSNTGVTFTTDQFGRSNMAGEWDADTDNLSWTSTVGNTIAEKYNLNSTMLYFIKMNTSDYSVGRNFINQYLTNSNSSILNLYRSDGAFTNSYDIANFNVSLVSRYTIDNVISDGVWEFHCLSTKKINATDVEFNFYDNNTKHTKSDMKLVKEDSTAELRIGQRNDGIRSIYALLSNFRFYDVTLSDGEINILNNEKGRIRA